MNQHQQHLHRHSQQQQQQQPQQPPHHPHHIRGGTSATATASDHTRGSGLYSTPYALSHAVGATLAAPQSPAFPTGISDPFPEAVAFSSNAGRRVTLGGGGGGGATGLHASGSGSNNPNANTALDRRGSLSSLTGMDDLFGRRPSVGLDLGVGAPGTTDSLFGRRDSMDSTSAALDAAILDVARRRSSLWGPAGSAGGGTTAAAAAAAGGVGDMHDFSSLTSTAGLGLNARVAGLSPFDIPPLPPALPQHPNAISSIYQRQKQLQEQQRELEHCQKVLDFQRQQLLANMSERSIGEMALPPMQARLPQGGSAGLSYGTNRFGLEIGGTGSHANQPRQQQHFQHHQQQHPQRQQSHHPVQLSAASMAQQTTRSAPGPNWWVCQVCNTKAFASREEALSHEAFCREVKGRLLQDPLLPPMQDSSQRSAYSVGMDSSHQTHHSERTIGTSEYSTRVSTGPFAILQKPMPLAMPSDKDWLTPLHCFVRRHCVEVFTATDQDVAKPSKGKRKPIQVGQIGIRCPHCHSFDPNVHSRERGSVYYPTTISSIYNATMNLLQRHLHSCPAVPPQIMKRYETLKADDARSGTSKRYWIESALSLGLVDTTNGIRFSALRPPPPPTLTRQQAETESEVIRRNSNQLFAEQQQERQESPSRTVGKTPTTGTETSITKTTAVIGGQDENTDDTVEVTTSPLSPARATAAHARAFMGSETGHTTLLVLPEDHSYSTQFSFHLLSQMQPCVFTEADRLGKRKGLPPGFPGLACRHCFGGYGSGRFFPSSIKTLSDTSKTLNVLHNHMMRCRKCPADVRETLENLRGSHDEERAKMKFGSQKAFFARIWERLHGRNTEGGQKRRLSHSSDTMETLHDNSSRSRHSVATATGVVATGATAMMPMTTGGMIPTVMPISPQLPIPLSDVPVSKRRKIQLDVNGMM